MARQFENEEMRQAYERKRIRAARRRRRRRERRIRQCMVLGAGVLILGLVIPGAAKGLESLQKKQRAKVEQEELEVQKASAGNLGLYAAENGQNPEAAQAGEENQAEQEPDRENEQETGAAEESRPVYVARATEQTQQANGDVISNYAILIDLDTDQIVAQRNADTVINPASMTKILTVLTAAEQISEEDLDDTFTITPEIIDFSFANDCSNAGFEKGETVTVRDLFYGTILPSGGEAAAGLATYVSGSMDAFVELMNEKTQELGLSETAHFTNCAGLYDEDHHCTVYDMAMILKAAIDNEFCREVLSAHTYTTSATEQHPEGILLSNWFLRRIEDKDTGGEVVCGKTGYVQQSGSCAASYGVDKSGKEYICVTADAHSGWRCIYDHVALYKQFATEGEAAET